MAQDPVRWRLFVDESGRFDDPDDDVCTAGLLVRADVAGSTAFEIRRTLETALPGVPWPIHTAHLNVPVLLALAAVVAGELPTPMRNAPRVDEITLQALERMRRFAGEEIESALDRLRAGAQPDWSTLRRLDRQLAFEDRQLYQRLAGRVRRAHVAIGSVIATLAREAGRTGEHAIVMLSCGETERGDGSGAIDPATDEGSTRYLSSLACLLQRVTDVLARRAGSHELRLQVLSRPVVDLSRQKRFQLRRRHVEELAGRLVMPAGGRVRIVVEAVPFFDAKADPAVVLADFIANRSRPVLKRFQMPLNRIEETLENVIGVPARSGGPALSHLAATGRARAAVENGRQGQPPDMASLDIVDLRRWAREQAIEWAAALREAS